MAAQRNLPEIGSSVRFSPMREIVRLQRSIDRLFDEMMLPLVSSGISNMSNILSRGLLDEGVSGGYLPPVDIEETDSHYLVSLDIPGVSKNEVKIEVRDNQLVISGERKEEHVREKGVRHSVERVHGVFHRAFTLPGSIEADKIEANFDNGVLQIAVPKSEIAQKKSIPIGEGRGGIFKRLAEKLEKKEKVA